METTQGNLLPAASLDPPEIKSHPPTTTSDSLPDGHRPLGTAWRHSGWTPDRIKIHNALIAVSMNPRRSNSFAACGENVWLYQNEATPDDFIIRGNRCHDRFCVPCANENAHKVARVVQRWIEKRSCRFLTLTLKHKDEPLDVLLDRLRDGFNKLRQRKAWKQRVFGGVAFFECTYSEGGRWHPHLHILIEGHYFPQPVLVREWKDITGDSHVVDIRSVKDSWKAAQYVAKYATKGWNHRCLSSPKILEEAIVALHGRRLATTFGTWRSLALHDREQQQKWLPVMAYSELQGHANAGEPWAEKMLAYLGNPLENPSPGEPPHWAYYRDQRAPPDAPRNDAVQLDLFHNTPDGNVYASGSAFD
jgi:hypothetical protein